MEADRSHAPNPTQDAVTLPIDLGDDITLNREVVLCSRPLTRNIYCTTSRVQKEYP